MNDAPVTPDDKAVKRVSYRCPDCGDSFPREVEGCGFQLTAPATQRGLGTPVDNTGAPLSNQ
jgi:hypothetical protein